MVEYSYRYYKSKDGNTIKVTDVFFDGNLIGCDKRNYEEEGYTKISKEEYSEPVFPNLNKYNIPNPYLDYKW